jgi:nucleotide-binding universal stress UspA family protein
MTGWAVTKRLLREVSEEFVFSKAALIVGAIISAVLTSFATIIIFRERFFEGAWTYLILIPLLYAAFSYFRSRLGAPSQDMDYLGQLDAAQLAGFGFGQMELAAAANGGGQPSVDDLTWQPAPIEESNWRKEKIKIGEIAVLLDGSSYAAQALPLAELLCKQTGATLYLLSSVKDYTDALKEKFEETSGVRQLYLERMAKDLRSRGLKVEVEVRSGFIAEATQSLVDDKGIDIVLISDRGKSSSKNWGSEGASKKLMRFINVPVIIVPTLPRAEAKKAAKIDKLIVGLDGSIRSEKAITYAREIAKATGSEIVLLTVPAVPETTKYRAAAEVVEKIRQKAEGEMSAFLSAVAESLRKEGLTVSTLVTGTHPARTIVTQAEENSADLILLTSRGRGGMDLIFTGSAAERVVDQSELPVLMVPTAGSNGG